MVVVYHGLLRHSFLSVIFSYPLPFFPPEKNNRRMEVSVSFEGTTHSVEVTEGCTVLGLLKDVAGLVELDANDFQLALADGSVVGMEEKAVFVRDLAITSESTITVAPDNRRIAQRKLPKREHAVFAAEMLLSELKCDGLEDYLEAGYLSYEACLDAFIESNRQNSPKSYSATETVTKRETCLSRIIQYAERGVGSPRVTKRHAEMQNALFGEKHLFHDLVVFNPPALFTLVMEKPTLFDLSEKIDTVNAAGSTPLISLTKLSDWCLSVEETMLRAKSLRSLGASLNIQDSQGWTALMWAVEGGWVELSLLFLSEGAAVHPTEKAAGRHVLHLALTPLGIPLIDHVVPKEAKARLQLVNKKDSKGYAPLALALLLPGGFALTAATLLLRYGADPTELYTSPSEYPLLLKEAMKEATKGVDLQKGNEQNERPPSKRRKRSKPKIVENVDGDGEGKEGGEKKKKKKKKRRKSADQGEGGGEEPLGS